MEIKPSRYRTWEEVEKLDIDILRMEYMRLQKVLANLRNSLDCDIYNIEDAIGDNPESAWEDDECPSEEMIRKIILAELELKRCEPWYIPVAYGIDSNLFYEVANKMIEEGLVSEDEEWENEEDIEERLNEDNTLRKMTRKERMQDKN